jgi:uncharacterized linocin/CFP29 family protein
MVTLEKGPARVGAPREVLGSGGKWAAERFMAAAAAGRPLSPSELRTLETLRDEEWKAFDNQLILGAQDRLRAVADVLGAGLVITITNGLAKTVLEYDTIGDMDDAIVSLDGVTRSENDRLEFERRGLPLPITHKDWYLNLRTLLASRTGGDPLDTTYIRIAGRKIGEANEDMLVNGGKTFAGLTVYGYTTHPERQTASFGTNGNWGQAAKTGENILVDVQAMVAKMNAVGRYGPFVIYVGTKGGATAATLKLNEDFKANSDKTIRQRILELDEISDIRALDRLAANNILMVDLSPDVVQMVSGEPLQTVQWDVHGGFQINFKAFQILVPLVRANADNETGVVHMT